MKTLIQYKYHALCFLLFSSLVANVFLIHSNRIYEGGILQAMECLGIMELGDEKLSSKEQAFLLNQYLKELWLEEIMEDF